MIIASKSPALQELKQKNGDSIELSSSTKKGGFRATIFVLVLSSLESIGFTANATSLVLYFHLVLQFGLSSSATTLTNYMGSVFLITLFGGFISDTYLNRLYTCLLFGVFELMGLFLLTIQAYSSKLHPDHPCGKSTCIKGGQAAMFYIAIGSLAIGAGGARGVLPALGADQFITKGSKGEKGVASFFNYYQFFVIVGSIIGVTVVVWISMNKDWYWGFLIGLLTAFVGYVVLAFGKPFYAFRPFGNSPLTKIAQVVVVAIRNRRSTLPRNPEELYEVDAKETDTSEEIISHTSQFRYLDRAAIRQQGMEMGGWNVCTVTQVEQVKILIRMLPIIVSTIILNTCLAQNQTFAVLQGYTMNPHLGSFKVPSASIPVIPLLFIAILLPIYEFFFVPFARKITGHPSGITQLQRVGVGLFLSIVSMIIAGVIEVKRRDQALKDPRKPISLFWLSFQSGIVGSSDMFSLVGLMEFYYRESPEGMKSLATSFAPLSLSFGYFLSSVIVNVVNAVSKKTTSNKQGWLESPDLNKNKLNYFYWFLAILSFLNFVNYLFWASWYKYRNPDGRNISENEVEIENKPSPPRAGIST